MQQCCSISSFPLGKADAPSWRQCPFEACTRADDRTARGQPEYIWARGRAGRGAWRVFEPRRPVFLPSMAKRFRALVSIGWCEGANQTRVTGPVTKFSILVTGSRIRANLTAEWWRGCAQSGWTGNALDSRAPRLRPPTQCCEVCPWAAGHIPTIKGISGVTPAGARREQPRH